MVTVTVAWELVVFAIRSWVSRSTLLYHGSNQNIVVAERLIYKFNGVRTSFTEMMALPNSQLDSIYWFPWYNNADLDTQLRFGMP